MSNKQLRSVLRWGHIVVGSMMAAFIYSPTLQASGVYAAVLQFVAMPLVGVSGVMMWQQARISKWRRGRQATNSQEETVA